MWIKETMNESDNYRKEQKCPWIYVLVDWIIWKKQGQRWPYWLSTTVPTNKGKYYTIKNNNNTTVNTRIISSIQIISSWNRSIIHIFSFTIVKNFYTNDFFSWKKEENLQNLFLQRCWLKRFIGNANWRIHRIMSS